MTVTFLETCVTQELLTVTRVTCAVDATSMQLKIIVHGVFNYMLRRGVLSNIPTLLKTLLQQLASLSSVVQAQSVYCIVPRFNRTPTKFKV